MNPIKTGFTSTHWIKLMESSEYQALSKAIDDDNQIAMAHMYNALRAIRRSDVKGATEQANQALVASDRNEDGEASVDCPYCDDGVIEVESPVDKSDPYYIKTTEVTCASCKGSGKRNVSELFSDELNGTYPENGIVAILRNDYDGARKIAKGIFDKILKNEYGVKQNSLDSHFM